MYNGFWMMDRGGIEPPTFALRTRHYTPKPPALMLVFGVCFYLFSKDQFSKILDNPIKKSIFEFFSLEIIVETEQTFCYIGQANEYYHESTHS